MLECRHYLPVMSRYRGEDDVREIETISIFIEYLKGIMDMRLQVMSGGELYSC